MATTEMSMDNITTQLNAIGTASPPDPLPHETYTAMGIYLVIVEIVAISGNMTVVVVIGCRRRRLLKFKNLLLLNMAVADLLVALIAYPLTAVSSFHGEQLFEDVSCWTSGFYAFCLTVVSLNTETFIAVFRYILVCKPSLHYLRKPQTAKPVIITIWVHAVLWTSLPLLGWNCYTPEPFKVFCIIDWTAESFSGRAYIVLTVLLCYVLQLSVVVFCYVNVFRQSGRLSFGAQGNSSLMRLDVLRWHHSVECERRVTKMFAIMGGAIFVCLTPYTVVSLIATSGLSIPVDIYVVPTMFAKLSCVTNPIIYAFMSSKFREGLCDLCPWSEKNLQRVGSGVPSAEACEDVRCHRRHPPDVRKYRGSWTQRGVYIGNQSVSLEIQSSVF